jgi:hypothetical protein
MLPYQLYLREWARIAHNLVKAWQIFERGCEKFSDFFAKPLVIGVILVLIVYATFFGQ